MSAVPANTASETTTKPRRVRAWDIPTRLFHWLLVTLIASAIISTKVGDPTMLWHKWNGYSILTLLVWRAIWGFVGGTTSRFAMFFPWPWRVFPYLVASIKGKAGHFLGHNPLGAIMIFLLMAAVIAQGTAGLMTTDDIIVSGPLASSAPEGWSSFASWYHARGFWVIASLVGLHILANLAYTFVKKDNLIGAMITGQKPAMDYSDAAEAKGGSLLRAALALALAAGLVFGGLIAFGDGL